MKYIKTFENKKKSSIEEHEEFEEKLNQIAIYLDENLGMSEDDGFVDCTWSDYNYENDGAIYIEFDFISNIVFDIEDFDDKIHNYLSQYDNEYKYVYKTYSGAFRDTGHDVYTIKLNDADIDKLYKEAEVYNQAKKYNL